MCENTDQEQLRIWTLFTQYKPFANIFKFYVLIVFDFCNVLMESAKLRAWRACVLACLACLCACVLACLACLRACVLTCLACLRAWRACMHVLCLRASYDACLACLPLTYSRFCLIIYFVCINQGFAIKRKLLIHVNLS